MSWACRLQTGLLASGLCLFSGHSLSAAPAAAAEPLLLKALHLQQDGDEPAARRALETLLRQHPNFHLARWLHDEQPVIDCAQPPVAMDIDRRGWREEACARLAAEAARPVQGWLPDALIQLDAHSTQVIVVDLSLARLYLFRAHKGRLSLVRAHYAAMGREGFGKQDEGDLRTPLGLYRIQRWLDGARLPELYGTGALTLDYPNRWDALNHRAGDGIWLHGVPSDTYVRAPHSSEGCITMANADVLALRQATRSGETLVVISDRLHWLGPDDFAAARSAWVARIEDWAAARSSTDLDAIRADYSAGFSSDGRDIYSFRLHKQALTRDLAPPRQVPRDLELLRMADNDDEALVRARFSLRALGNGHGVPTLKVQQVWRQEGTDWKIIREEIGAP